MKPLVDIIILGSKPIKGMKSKGPLSDVGILKNQTLIENQIKNIKKKININKIFYVGGYRFADLLKHQNINYINNSQYDIKNNGYSLKLALAQSNADRVLIIFNKVILSHNIFHFFNFNYSQIFISDYIDYSVGSTLNNSSIINLFYNLDNKCCGIYYITGHELKCLKEICLRDNIDNVFIFEIINRTIDMGGNYRFNKVTNKNSIFIVNNNKTLEYIKKYANKYFSI